MCIRDSNLAINGVTGIDALAGTTNIVNGTFNFGLGFPGAPATNVDFTNATVTGLPGGAAGLENGTGTNSLQSAAALTTNPADAAGNGSIAIGDGASATRQESVAIGQGAEANGTGSEGSIAIGHGSIASSNRGIAIGINGTTNSSEGIVIGDDVDISGSDRSVAIGGAINISGGSDKVAIGTSAAVSGQRGLAFGQNASATANEAIAIGYNVTAANAQTLSVKALETQTDSTPTAGGIIMSDAGGTDRRINIDASGALQIDSTPVGGGGGADEAEGQNITPALGGASQIYSIPWTLSGYSKTNARSFSGNDMMLVPFYAKPGETIDDFYFRIQTAQASATMNVALYKSYVATVQTNQKVLMPEYVATIATGVDVSTSGKKSYTGLAELLPTDAVGGQYWIGFLCDTAGVTLTKWSNWVANERIIYNDIYRGNGVDYTVGSMTIPTGQVNISSAQSSTDLSVDFAWTYQS